MTDEFKRLTVENKSQMMDKLAEAINFLLSEMYGQRMGFALFMFEFGGNAGDYLSNASRHDMIKFMREIADRLEAGEDIGRPMGTA